MCFKTCTGEAWWCVHRGYQNTLRTNFPLPEAGLAQAIRNLSQKLPAEAGEMRIMIQNAPEHVLRTFMLRKFLVSSMIHVHLTTMSQYNTVGNSTIPLSAVFVGRWLLAEQPEALMQRFAFVSLFSGTCATRHEASFGFC